MTLAQELSSRRPAASLAPASQAKVASTPAPEPLAVQAAGALADALKTASACAELAGQIDQEIEKSASEGVGPEVSNLRLNLRKSAYYLGDLVELVGAQKRAHASLLDQFAAEAQVGEALKLASEMIRDGLVPVPDDFDGYVRELASQNLTVVKAAAEMAARNEFADLGSPEKYKEKTAADVSAHRGAGGNADWERDHGFLLNS